MSADKIEKEVRFAVVMYGGGSLAIYINGIAQELLKMVRATAFKPNSSEFQLEYHELTQTEKVYRDISYFLGDESLVKDTNLLPDYKEWIQKGGDESKAENPLQKYLEDKRQRGETVKVARFIVDILTGSSAGGINAVFLAKALANDQKIDSLKGLWLSEGAFSKLIYDKGSFEGIEDLPRPEYPESLLNSRRMYYHLLKALDDMDLNDTPPESPNADEIDLFVTVTDFAGVSAPLRLFDRVVYERRHKQFFHFKYDRENRADNNFKRSFNPFLAFAARSTSAFPLAFEPMSLSDIDNVIKEYFPRHTEGHSGNSQWQDFFANFKLPAEEDGKPVSPVESHKNRYFVDGGALDNKPFGFALKTLLRRQSDVPIDRKLIYVEPSPEFLGKIGDKPEKPDALQNLLAQASGLPRYETIREDLQVLLDHNRLVGRVSRLIKNVENDVYATLSSKSEIKIREQSGNGVDWERRTLKDVVELKGPAFLLYYRLRLIAVTDGIARLVTDLYGYNTDSDDFLAVRSLVRFWRENVYEPKPDAIFSGKAGQFVEADDPRTVNSFLRRFDIDYRFRRLRFVIQKAEQLYIFDDEIKNILKERKHDAKAYYKREAEQSVKAGQTETTQEVQYTEQLYPFLDAQTKKWKQIVPSLTIIENTRLENQEDAEDAAKIEELRAATAYFQKELNDIFQKLRRSRRLLSKKKLFEEIAASQDIKDDSFDELKMAFAAINLKSDDLRELLGSEVGDYDEEAIFRRAADFFKKDESRFEDLAKAGEKLKRYINKQLLQDARERIEGLLEPIWETPLKDETAELNRLENLASRLSKSEELRVGSELFEAVRGYLWHYYNKFDDYDQISFPIYYETPLGEADTVEIVRISPHDAQTLICETDKNERRRKLAGDYLYGFGAFLDAGWRQNDIMWGRLDGAERLVVSLLPGEKFSDLRTALISRTQNLILKEELIKSNTDETAKLFASALLQMSAGKTAKDAVTRSLESLDHESAAEMTNLIAACLKNEKVADVFRQQLTAKLFPQNNTDRQNQQNDTDIQKQKKINQAVSDTLSDAEVQKVFQTYFEADATRQAFVTNQTLNRQLKSAVGSCLDKNEIIGFMRDHYEINRRLNPQEALDIVSRSTQVIGKLMENIAERNAQAGARLAWIARLGTVFWGMIEIAVPGSLPNLFWRHWLKLLYIFEAFLIFGGILLGDPGVQRFGLLALLLTTALNLTTLFLQDKMRGRSGWKKAAFLVLIGIAAVFLALGIFFFVALFFVDGFWERMFPKD